MKCYRRGYSVSHWVAGSSLSDQLHSQGEQELSSYGVIGEQGVLRVISYVLVMSRSCHPMHNAY